MASVRTLLLATSSVIATVSAARPTNNTCLRPMRRESDGRANEPAMARITWGRKSSPYWPADRSYASGLVRIVAAAGTATRLSPWNSPAA